MMKVYLGLISILSSLFFLSSIQAQHLPEKILLDGGEFAGGYLISNDSAIGTIGGAANGSFNNGRFTVGKYDVAFNPKWTKGYGDHSVCLFEMHDMLFLPDGGSIVTGTKRDSASGITSGIMLRTDSSGNVIFIREIVDSLGNYGSLEPEALLPNTDSTFVLICRLWDKGSIAVSIVDLTGQIVKTQHYRVTNFSYTAFYQKAIRRANGNYVVIGKDDYFSGSVLMYLEFSPQLTLINHINYFVSNVGMMCYDVTENPADQSVLLTGFDSNSAFLLSCLIKLDPSGNVIWSKSVLSSVNRSVLGNAIVKDNKYYFTGNNSYQQDFIPFVLVTDTAGNILNSETYRHTGQYTTFYRAIDMQDSIVIPFTGEINSDFGPGRVIIDTTLYSSCSADEITFTDSLFTVTQNQDLHSDTTHLIYVDHTSEYYDTTYTNTLADYCLLNKIPDETQSGNNVGMYLHENILTLQISDFDKYSDLFLFDTSGKLITQICVNSELTNLDLSRLSGGIYLIRVKGLEKVFAGKIVYTGKF
jgi:hypothetical protein